MVGRRTLLASTIPASVAPLSGCAGVLDGGSGERSDDRHYVSVYNGSQESHVIAVTVANGVGETIFDRTYDFDPRTGDENSVIDGNPDAFSVAIDDAEPDRFQWAPQGSPHAAPDRCSDGTTASLDIYYQLASDEAVTPVYGCQTVTE